MSIKITDSLASTPQKIDLGNVLDRMSVLCGGHGAMSVTNLVENSIHEVLVLYGGYNNPKFEVINKKGDVCIAATIPGICLLC